MTRNESAMELGRAIIAGDYKSTKLLLDSGVSANEPDSFGVPLIFQAVTLGRSRIVRLLRSHGANLEVQDLSGKTPLELAEFYGNEFMIEAIVEGRAKNAENDKGEQA